MLTPEDEAKQREEREFANFTIDRGRFSPPSQARSLHPARRTTCRARSHRWCQIDRRTIHVVSRPMTAPNLATRNRRPTTGLRSESRHVVQGS
jgi:hypothetical protein